MTSRCSAQLLGRTRLLTLTGPGGTGKTSLALELARRHAEDFEDGACLVDLQSVDDVGQVAAEVAHGVGLLDGPTGSAADRLEGYLADRALLLVIDNFEQVIDAAPEVARVLAASPGSRAHRHQPEGPAASHRAGVRRSTPGLPARAGRRHARG